MNTWKGEKTEKVSKASRYVPILKAIATDDGGITLTGIGASEMLDGSGEVSDYSSLKAVFEAWFPIGNVREQHDFTKAVGTALEWEPNDEKKEISVKVHISAGAPETIQKIKDGVLKGFSVMGDVVRRFEGGNTKLYWRKLKELSVVDSPDIPDCRFQIAKAAKGADMADESKDIAMLESMLAAIKELIDKAADDETKTKLNALLESTNALLENEKNEGGEGEEPPPEKTSKEMEAAKAKVADLEGQLEKAKADMAECNKAADEKCKAAEAEAKEKCAKATGELDTTKGELTKMKEELEKAQKAAGDFKSVNEKLDTVMKTIKEPGTPVTKGDEETSKPDFTGIPEEWVTAIKASNGDITKLQSEFLTLSTGQALGMRKEK